MKGILIGIAAAIAVVSPVCAQVPSPSMPQPVATYPNPNSYRFVAPTPEDAYRQGLTLGTPTA
jgi:hypothetical protein